MTSGPPAKQKVIGIRKTSGGVGGGRSFPCSPLALWEDTIPQREPLNFRRCLRQNQKCDRSPSGRAQVWISILRFLSAQGECERDAHIYLWLVKEAEVRCWSSCWDLPVQEQRSCSPGVGWAGTSFRSGHQQEPKWSQCHGRALWLRWNPETNGKLTSSRFHTQRPAMEKRTPSCLPKDTAGTELVGWESTLAHHPEISSLSPTQVPSWKGGGREIGKTERLSKRSDHPREIIRTHGDWEITHQQAEDVTCVHIICRMKGRCHHQQKIRKLCLIPISWRCVQFLTPVNRAMITRMAGFAMGWPSACPGIRSVGSGLWMTRGWRTEGQGRIMSGDPRSTEPKGGECSSGRGGGGFTKGAVRLLGVGIVLTPYKEWESPKPWNWTAEAWHLPKALLVIRDRNPWEPAWAKPKCQWKHREATEP